MQVRITLQNNAAVSDPTTLHTTTSDSAKFHANDHNYKIIFPNGSPFSVSDFTVPLGADVTQVPTGAQGNFKYNLKNLDTGEERDPRIIIQP
jgi:hypothetical protein